MTVWRSACVQPLTNALNRSQLPFALARACFRWLKRHWLRAAYLFVGLLLAATLSRKTIVIRDQALLGRDHLLVVESALANLDLDTLTPARVEQLNTELGAAEANWDRVQAELAPLDPFLDASERIPIIGSRIRASRLLLDMAVNLSASGHAMTQGLIPLAREIETGRASGSTLAERLDGALKAGEPYFERSRAAAFDASAERNLIDVSQLDGPLSGAARVLTRLDNKWDLLLDLTSTLADLPRAFHTFMGFDRPYRYLVLGQNGDEIRATGGFVGSAGLLTINRGKIEQFDYKSSYFWDDLNRSRAQAPAPQSHYMLLGGWYLRDANWSPDIPTSAKVAEQFFLDDQNVQVDGVILLDPIAVKYLLEATGPIEVPGFAGKVDSQNFVATTYENIYGPGAIHPQAAWQERKNEYLDPLFKAVMSKLLQLPAGEAPSYVKALRKAIEDKRLMLYLHDPAGERMVDRIGGSGRLYGGAGDYIYPVDTTMAYSKVAGFIGVSTDISATLDSEGRPVSTTVRITYHNRFNAAEAAGLYLAVGGEHFDPVTGQLTSEPGIWADYLRLLVPLGSTLKSAGGFDDPVEAFVADNKMTFAGYFLLRPGETRTMTITYAPPDRRLPDGDYSLFVQRQPGTEGRQIHAQINGLPGNSVFSPQPSARSAEFAEFSAAFDRDLHIQVSALRASR